MATARKVAKKKATKKASKKVESKLPREVKVSKEVEILKVIVETPLNLRLTAEVSEIGLTNLDVDTVLKDKGTYVCTSSSMYLESVCNMKEEEFEDLVLAIRGLREENRKNQLLLKAKK